MNGVTYKLITVDATGSLELSKLYLKCALYPYLNTYSLWPSFSLTCWLGMMLSKTVAYIYKERERIYTDGQPADVRLFYFSP